MDDLVKMVKETGLPFAYDHFEEGEAPELPFVCYLLPQSNHFSADGRVYLKITEVHIELYTDCKDLSAEQKVEAVLDKHGIFYEKSDKSLQSVYSSIWTSVIFRYTLPSAEE